ncbi:MAG: C39 family peptidase [Candidatus Riflebacteria bacterium]|nr:C39 family peptidase [Candidatus Riflebacteria bacterium]
MKVNNKSVKNSFSFSRNFVGIFLFFFLFPFSFSDFLQAKEKPSSTKKMLKIKGFQQWNDFTCGPASILTLLNYYGVKGDGKKIAEEMGTLPTGTHPASITAWLNKNGFDAEWRQNTKKDGSRLDLLREYINQGIPILLEWVDWGGHWVVLAGYDDKGTKDTRDDEIFFADPYDIYDGKKNGFTSFNAERFDSMWFDSKSFDIPMEGLHIIAFPKKHKKN